MDKENVAYIQNGELFCHKENWIEREFILLREISQTQKAKYHIFTYICGIYT
jgi:hypothetical protein